MSKNFEKEKMSVKMPVELIEIPAACVTQLFFDVHCLLGMHEQLIRMYEVESMLKKHHKAYLHIREKADEMCRADKELMSEIIDHYQNPAKYMDETLRFHNLLMKLDEECGESPVYPTAEEIYKRIKALQEDETGQDKSLDEAKVGAVNGAASENASGGKGSVDRHKIPETMVMMSAETLGVMQDDMLALTVVVDHLVEAIRRIKEGGFLHANAMEMLTKEAAKFSREVFERWDSADSEKWKAVVN